jgi:hypothetical protein
MSLNFEAKTSKELYEILDKAAQGKTATFIFFNDTQFEVYDINHGWEYRTGGGLVSVGNRLQPGETLTKSTPYEAGCMVRCIGNYKINGTLSPNFRSKDASDGKCYGTYRVRLYTPTQVSGETAFALEILEDATNPTFGSEA